MSTNNFENAKNGIFVIEPYEPVSYEEWLEDMGYDLSEGVEQALKEEYEEYLESDDTMDMAVEDAIGDIISDLKSKSYETIQVTPYDYKVTGNGMDGHIGLILQSGYYAGAQVIVTTQRDEQFMDANMEEEDITKDLYDFVDEQGFTEYTDDKSDFEDNPEYRLNEVLHNVLWSGDTYEDVLDDMLPDDKVVLDVVSQYTTPLKKVDNFSNGEALYEKA